MDFFAAKAAESSSNADDVDSFAKAIADRFKHSPVITANLNAPLPKKLSAPSVPLPPDRFGSIAPQDIQPYLDDPSTLFIDIRPHAAYTSARLPNALSLSVPSTLLKRPLFPLERLATMLPSVSARNRFSKWQQTSRLIVYDADSSGNQSGHLPEGNNILGLLRKFANDSDGAYKGQLLWLKGGFQSVWKERRALVDTRPLDADADEDEPVSTTLRPNNLPMTAFGSSSTTVNKSGLTSKSSRPTFARNQSRPTMAFNPFFDAIRQNVELSQGITEMIPLLISKRVRRRLRDLPFSWLREIGRRAGIQADDDTSDDGSLTDSPSRVPSVSFPSPDSLSTSSPSGESSSYTPPDQTLVDEGMEALAMQFYRIELSEQRRLMGVMQHHTKESETQFKPETDVSSSSMKLDAPPASSGPQKAQISPDSPFPYSITAGIEKGAKNRYRHIWPFEHARVRIHQEPGPEPPMKHTFQPHYGSSHTSSDISLNPSGSVLQPPQSSNSSSNPSSNSLLSQGSTSSSATSSTSIRPPSGPLSGPGRPFTLSLPSSSSSRPYAPLGSPRRSAASPSPSRSGSGKSTTRSPRPNARGLKLDLGLGGGNSFASARSGAQTFGGTGGSSGGTQMSPPKSTAPATMSFNQIRGGNGSGGSGGESAIESSGATDSEREHQYEDGYQSSAHGRREGRPGKAQGKEHDDYVNASYVQPFCTTRRYIATQGPLEATFTDFWTIVYQQNVHVIVMLTREVEGSMVKCGSYWKDEVYGPLRLKLIDVTGVEEDSQTDMRKTRPGQHSQQTQGQIGPDGFQHASIKDEGSFSFFPSVKTEEMENKKREQKKRKKEKRREERKERKRRAKEEDMDVDAGVGKEKAKRKHSIPSKHKSIVKRTFLLSHTGYPHIPARKVVQFQYLGWPDMNVPEHPTGLLSLIKQVDIAVENAEYLPGEELEAEVKLQDPRRTPGEIDRSTGIAKQAMGKRHAPVLLHCSAGVGRTGGYIVVDAVLDSLRREFRNKLKMERDAEKLMKEAQEEMAEERINMEKVDEMDVELGSEMMKEAKRKEDAMEVDSTLAEFNEDDVDDIDMTDGTSSSEEEATGKHAAADAGEDSQAGVTGAVPLNNGNNVLHIPQYTKGHDAATDVTPSGQPPSSGKKSSSSNVILRTPMKDIDQRVEEMWRHPATTRGWAENVSDQTGRHGSAFRVDQARSAFQSQSRLSERDRLPKVRKDEIKGKEIKEKEIKGKESTPDVSSEKQTPETALSSSGRQSQPRSDSSPSNSDDSFGFDSTFDKDKGHKVGYSLSYGRGNHSSFGTSVSSLPLGSTPLKRLSQGPDPESAEAATSHKGESSVLLPAADVHERARAISAPSPRPKQADDSGSDSSQLAANASAWLQQGEAPTASSPRPGSARESTPSSGSRSSPSGDGSFVANVKKLKEVKSKLLGEIGACSQVSLGSGGVSSGSGGSVPPMSGSGSGSGSAGASGYASRSRSGSASISDPKLSLDVASASGYASRSRSGSASISDPKLSLDMTSASSSQPRSLTKADLKLKDVATAAVAKELSGGTQSDSGIDIKLPAPTAFDYAAPRTLHQDNSPKALDTFSEPLWEVVQDIRQQRMSLCQSLRQYVFVHTAILEGSLMIVDEESEKAEMGDIIDDSDGPEGEYAFKTPRAERKNLNLSPSHPTSYYTSTSSSVIEAHDPAEGSPMKNFFPTISIGKRLPSPTELPQEDKQGRQLLHKKPSLKRKNPSSSSSNEASSQEGRPGSPRKSSALHPPRTRHT